MPFQAYRLRLQEMLEELLEWLERDHFPLFVLDGQTVLLDDVFSLRPEWKSRVEKLVRQGKIKIGPWYTMPDLFLARPESLIRNLQRGLSMADDLGGASRVGYVPDSFGHFAQLPQILAGFQIHSFFFMRGMPESLRDQQGALFSWVAPDGSAVLATYLREGYFPLGALGQASFHGRYDGLSADFDAAQKRLNETLARLTPVQKNSVFVLPAGGDHLPARADLPEVIAHLNSSQNEIELRFGCFEDYLEQLRMENLEFPQYCGDLLGQADHPLLRNVLSSRVDLKILNHQAQSLLCGVVEPLLAWSRLNRLPLVHETLLQTAWDALLKNHAHDDICGCSVDDVHLDNTQRYHEILALGREIITRQLEHGVQHVWGGLPHSRCARVLVFNPHPWPQKSKVRAWFLLPDIGGEFSDESEARTLVARTSAGNPVEVNVLRTECKDIRNAYLETTWGRSYEIVLDAQLPPLGFELLTIEETEVPLGLNCAKDLMSAGGSQSVPQELLNAFSFELSADLGDGYSFGPCPEIPTEKSKLISARSDATQSNLFHLQFEIAGHLFVNRNALNQSPFEECLGPRAKMVIDVKAHQCKIENKKREVEDCAWKLEIQYKNIFSDSRLRILTTQPEYVTSVFSDAQALWQQHNAVEPQCEIWPGLLAEPRYPGEKPYPVLHTNDGVVSVSQSMTAFCGGVGLHEFEIVKSASGNAVALTLHRAVGFLSVRGGRIRSCQAGPQRRTPDAQLQREISHVVALGTCSTLEPASAFRTLKQILHPVWVQELPSVPAGAALGAIKAQSICDLSTTALQLLSCRPSSDGEGIFIRLLNPTALDIQTDLCLHEALQLAQEYQLDDHTPCSAPKVKIDNHKIKINFKPFEIKTWKFLTC